MLPAWQRPHAFEPSSDRGIIFGDVESEFLGRVIKIAGHGNIGDGRLVAYEEQPPCQSLVDDSKVAVDAPLKKRQYCWVAWGLCEILQEPQRTEEAVDLLIVENDPAQRFQFLVVVFRFELSATFGEVGEYHAGLREFLLAMHEHGRLAHFIDVGAKLRCALDHCTKKIDPDWLPV